MARPKPHHQVINLSNQYFVQLGANYLGTMGRYNLFPRIRFFEKICLNLEFALLIPLFYPGTR